MFIALSFLLFCCQNSPLLLFLEHKSKPAPNGCFSAKSSGGASSCSPVGKAAGRPGGKCHSCICCQFCLAGQLLAHKAT